MRHLQDKIPFKELSTTSSNSHVEEDGAVDSMHTKLANDSKTLLIAFGSMRFKHRIPPFEFDNAFKDIPVKTIFVRDLHQLWYQRGLPGIAESIDGVGSYLQNIIAQQSVEKVVTFGGSMGGYAALYFGWYIDADEVHAFAPKTFLSPLKRVFYGDFKWDKRGLNHPLNRKIIQLYRDHQVQKSNLDLKKILRDNNHKTTYCLYYSQQNRRDRLHCERMKDIPRVELHTHERGGHHILNDMKESGILDKIIRGSL